MILVKDREFEFLKLSNFNIEVVIAFQVSIV